MWCKNLGVSFGVVVKPISFHHNLEKIIVAGLHLLKLHFLNLLSFSVLDVCENK